MYIDESGGTDEVTTAEEMTVTVDGDEYTTEMNLDMAGDGDYDAVAIQEEDGSARVFIDTDRTGEADEYVEVDEQGQTVAVATYDEATGEWLAADPQAQGPQPDETQTGAEGPMTAEFPDGQVEIGPPTVDTNHDGTPDTAVVEHTDGTSYYFTDTTGDGAADVAVVLAADGSSTALEHTGDGQWVEVEPTELGDASTTAGGTADGTTAPSGFATIDPTTGQWITQ